MIHSTICLYEKNTNINPDPISDFYHNLAAYCKPRDSDYQGDEIKALWRTAGFDAPASASKAVGFSQIT